MKGVLVILDGAADDPLNELGGKTPLEAAKTKNLDEIAMRGEIDYCYTVKEDFIPESDQGVLSLLGYDYRKLNRGTLEALGLDIKLREGDLVLRCNFATIDNMKDRNVIDRRAGRTLTTKEAKVLARALNENVKLPFKFKFYPSIQHRGVLVIRGRFSNKISRLDVLNGKINFSRSFDNSEESKLSAELVNKFALQSFDILDKHPLNIIRAKKGLDKANFVFCRGAGNESPKARKIKGKWMSLGYMPLEIGIGKALGMKVYRFNYPQMRGEVYHNLYSGLNRAIKNSVKMLKRNKNRYDYFYIHIKETDIPGHDGRYKDKVKMIELLDKKFFSFLKRIIGDSKLIVTADHATSCTKKAHSSNPVPVLIYPGNGGKRFTEKEGMKGRKIESLKLLDNYMF